MSRNVVTTKLGTIKGYEEENVSIWRGIPYAEAPNGASKFLKPVPKRSWEGELDAASFKAKCPQPALPFAPDNGLPQSEDCLYLNIWSQNTEEKQPVLFWISGGNFVLGEGSDGMYDGTKFCKNGNIVVVTFNYRVGVWGGFYDLAQYDTLKGKYDNNCGIFDILEALRWVRNNISAFGGNPEDITIMGESAGAYAAAALLSMPQADGMFKKAILESFPALGKTKEQSKEIAEQYLDNLSLKPETAEGILSMSNEDLLAGISHFSQGDNLKSGTSIICNEDIPDYPENMIVHGENASIPILIGTNLDEGAVFFPENTVLKNICTDQMFLQPSLKIADSVSRQTAVYMYRFDFIPPAAAAMHMGAFHSAEIIYVFGNLNPMMIKGAEREAQKVSADMQNAWINFIRTGKPGEDWSLYDAERSYTKIFN